MKNLHLFPAFIVLLFVAACYNVLVVKSVAKSKDEWIDDPSLAARPLIPVDEYSSRERWRVVGDFNGDGIEDMALSISISANGTGGNGFSIYLGRADGKFKKIAETWVKRGSFNVQERDGQYCLWAYYRLGPLDGTFECYHLGRENLQYVEKIPWEFDLYDIEPTYPEGYKLASKATLRLEISKTVSDTVTWYPENY